MLNKETEIMHENTRQSVLAAYDFPETLLGAARYGQDRINDFGDSVRFGTNHSAEDEQSQRRR